jgi:hypothetical protein
VSEPGGPRPTQDQRPRSEVRTLSRFAWVSPAVLGWGALGMVVVLGLALLSLQGLRDDSGRAPAAAAPGPSDPSAGATTAAPSPTSSGAIAATSAPAQSPGPAGAKQSAAARAARAPASGTTYFGVQLDWATDTPSKYTKRSGIRPALYGEFVRFPISADSQRDLLLHASQAKAARAALFVTLEPFGGLSSVTPGSAATAARFLGRINASGVRVFVRFAHEMNGGWYPWGQQPSAYTTAFRTLADAVHRHAPGTLTVWSPNYGGGYPFTGGQYTAKPGSADFRALDTNRDGTLTMDDDMYAPFYPGDAYVDWVGLTLYFFGHQYPWGENEVPESGRFAGQVSGTFAQQPYADERGVPDFYDRYAVQHGKPMAISETSSLFASSASGGVTETAVKSAWMKQVLGAGTRSRFPLLAMINWFEFEKPEQGITGTVDWRATHQPDVLSALRAVLAASPGRFRFAPAS